MLPEVMPLNISFSNYLRIKEAANLLGVHTDTLRRWERLSKVPTYRHPVNGYRLYLEEDIQRLLSEVYPK